jgi:hypothetical protein
MFFRRIMIGAPIDLAPYKKRKLFPKGKSFDVSRFGSIKDKFILLVHMTMHLDNHNDNTCNNMMHLTNYKLFDQIAMHKHNMNKKTRNFHDINT